MNTSELLQLDDAELSRLVADELGEPDAALYASDTDTAITLLIDSGHQWEVRGWHQGMQFLVSIYPVNAVAIGALASELPRAICIAWLRMRKSRNAIASRKGSTP